MRSSKRSLCAALAVALAAVAAGPAAGGGEKPGRFDALRFRSLGPAAGGRVSRATGVAGDPLVYYAATAQGGVWKSTDGGFEWKPLFDRQPVASIGSVAVAPSDPNVVYVGSGEANIRGNVIAGQGIFVSTDAGATWNHGWKQVGQIGTIAVDPRDARVAFAAVLGHAFGPNPERGVYRTRDGGESWERVLFVDEDTGASDVAIDHSNPRILFAGTWQARRTPWDLTSGGPGSGLYRSADGGTTWKRLTGDGLPDGIWGKVGVAVAPSDGRRVYALIEADAGGLFRSDDGGSTWERINDHRALRQRAWYYSTMTVDPRDAETIWFPQVPLLRSIDGGRTVRYVDGYHHGDHHDLWIDPDNPARMILANDGGVEISLDGGESWRRPPLPIAQFYNVDADAREPFWVGGTMQDLGTAAAPVDSLRMEGIPLADWRWAGGGEAGDFAFDPFAEGITYAGEYGGILTVHDLATGNDRNVSIYPTNPSGHGAEELRIRFQWTAPVALSAHEPNLLYHAGNRLFRSRDRGRTWQAASPDLTRNDPARQGWAGGPITGDNTGVEIYDTIFSLALSPRDPGLIWAGTDDGLVQVSRDEGAHWTDVTPRRLPEWGTVECIETSPHAAGTAWVVVDAHRLDDQRPYLFRSDDFGATWKDLSSGLPADAPLFVVREDPMRAGLLFAGNERGVLVSFDGGTSWEPLEGGLPTAKVSDIVLRGESLVVATSGRSLWILDDLSPLRVWRDALELEALHLFAPTSARRWQVGAGWGGEGVAANPARGLVIRYRLAEKLDSDLALEIRDAGGRLVRTLSSVAEEREYAEDDPDEPGEEPEPALSTEAGLHEVVWDLAWEGADRLERAKVDLGSYDEGPVAAPGSYRLRIAGGDLEASAEAEVLPDPRAGVTVEDLVAQQDAALAALDAIRAVIADVRTVRAISEQAGELADRLRDDEARGELVTAADAAADRADELELELHNADAEVTYDILARRGGARLLSKLVFLYETLRWGDGAPTQGAREVGAELEAERARLHAAVEALVGSEVATVERLAKEGGLPRIVGLP